MVKRKTAAEETDQSESPVPSKKVITTKKPKFAPVYDSESEQSDEPKPKAKAKAKAKAKPINPSSSTSIPAMQKNSEGDNYIDLGKKKRATVRSFKGSTFVDIREYYGDESDLKPGKKGISLTIDQWNTLKAGMSGIDELFEVQNKK
ncbi:transcriptional Coactivator p15-domain-containing protein [Rhodocollybia butyracea]|uniref:Transcriptional Coactivator p15-domain-containing protein n=1 Tax=Rhodocollybia butyracea TaxID=206335 RepID=A0A9P5UB51_9AGAR|nr:transcriptional Coactivator p15-domain-containing protein [Rhodocollybia butyracea]